MASTKKSAKSTTKATKKKAATAKAPEPALPKIGKPATRALATIGITRLDQVVKMTAVDLLALHGVGPKAIRILEEELAAKGKSLRKAK